MTNNINESVNDRIHEKATETAKKIRGMLKKAFPGIKFSVKSSTYSMGSSVDVYWTDGPLNTDVEAILNRFKSGYFDGTQDLHHITGYSWEGQTYIGAKFIDYSRTIGGERKRAIESWLQENGSPDMYGLYGVSEWGTAERELIEVGELQGYPSQLPAVEIPLDTVLESEKKNVAKVIPFPVRSPEEIARRRAEQIMNGLTAEQKLKLECLRSMIGQETLALQLIHNPVAIDEMFRVAAEDIFG